MKKTIILLAGYPATGKTYLCNQILGRHSGFIVVSQDEIKEELWDRWGFDSLEEKTALEERGWKIYYETLGAGMRKGQIIISDYPFSEKQKGRLEELTEQYGYQAVTIRLLGDIDVLYQRSRERDLDLSRHLAHLVTRYHLGDVMEDRSKADALLSYETFRDRCEHKGYDKFLLGELLELDVTDYSSINYNKVLDRIDKLLE